MGVSASQPRAARSALSRHGRRRPLSVLSRRSSARSRAVWVAIRRCVTWPAKLSWSDHTAVRVAPRSDDAGVWVALLVEPSGNFGTHGPDGLERRICCGFSTCSWPSAVVTNTAPIVPKVSGRIIA